MQSACYWDTVIISDLHLGSDVSRASESVELSAHTAIQKVDPAR